jgi:Domain of unknown function (DUF4377)
MQRLNTVRRSNLTISLLGTLALGLSSCGILNQPEIQTLYVAPNKADCKGGFEPLPSPRLLSKQQPGDNWQCFLEPIEGFSYQPGYIYKLSIEVKKIVNPPADGPTQSFKLLSVIDKTASTIVAVPGKP